MTAHHRPSTTTTEQGTTAQAIPRLHNTALLRRSTSFHNSTSIQITPQPATSRLDSLSQHSTQERSSTSPHVTANPGDAIHGNARLHDTVTAKQPNSQLDFTAYHLVTQHTAPRLHASSFHVHCEPFLSKSVRISTSIRFKASSNRHRAYLFAMLQLINLQTMIKYLPLPLRIR